MPVFIHLPVAQKIHIGALTIAKLPVWQRFVNEAPEDSSIVLRKHLEKQSGTKALPQFFKELVFYYGTLMVPQAFLGIPTTGHSFPGVAR